MRIKSPPMIIDTTVISRYGFTQRFDILENLYCRQIVIPTEIIVESLRAEILSNCVQAALDAKWMQEYTLDYTKGQSELLEYVKLLKRFHYGECAVLAIAKNWNCTVASDDMSATRKYCKKNHIDQIGSLGILYDAFDSGLLNEIEAEELLQDMINLSRYKCPIQHFSEVINWFKNGIGAKEIF